MSAEMMVRSNAEMSSRPCESCDFRRLAITWMPFMPSENGTTIFWMVALWFVKTSLMNGQVRSIINWDL